MAAASGVRRIWVGQNGLLSTPAVSCIVRERVGHDVRNNLKNLHGTISPILYTFTNVIFEKYL